MFLDESGVQVTGDTGLGVERFRCPKVLFHRSAVPDSPDGNIIAVVAKRFCVDNETDLAGSEDLEGMKLVKHLVLHQLQVDCAIWVAPLAIIPYSCCVPSQTKCWRRLQACKNDLYFSPIQLEEKVATVHLPALGAVLTFLSRTAVCTPLSSR